MTLNDFLVSETIEKVYMQIRTFAQSLMVSSKGPTVPRGTEMRKLNRFLCKHGLDPSHCLGGYRAIVVSGRVTLNTMLRKME